MTETVKDPGLFVFQENSPSGSSGSTLVPSKPYSASAGTSGEELLQTPVTLYEYSLGLKDIQAKTITYGERQAYVSKPLTIPGSVMEIELEATEEHPVFDTISGKANPRQTSVEYYLSYKAKPSVLDWIPILPKNQKTVVGERLLFTGNEATLRFPAQMDASTFQVYANGLKVPAKDILFLSNQKVSVLTYSSSVLYTVDYTPDNYRLDPWTFKLNDYKYDVETITESFPDGTAFNNTLTLSYTPYVDMQQILAEETYNPNTSAYRPIRVRLVDASIQGRNQSVLKVVEPYREDLLNAAYTYNRTLYKDKSWSQLQAYQLDNAQYYGGFDYYHWKDKLTFTEQFNVERLRENRAYTHGNATIEVSYETLVTHFRLKIILRRNSAEELTATPKVSDYRLRFKTMQ